MRGADGIYASARWQRTRKLVILRTSHEFSGWLKASASANICCTHAGTGALVEQGGRDGRRAVGDTRCRRKRGDATRARYAGIRRRAAGCGARV